MTDDPTELGHAERSEHIAPPDDRALDLAYSAARMEQTDLADEELRLRAQVEAAKGLADALGHEVERSRRHLAQSTLAALAAWEAAQ